MPRSWHLEQDPNDEDCCELTFFSADGASWTLNVGSMAADEIGQALKDFADGQDYCTDGDMP